MRRTSPSEYFRGKTNDLSTGIFLTKHLEKSAGKCWLHWKEEIKHGRERRNQNGDFRQSLGFSLIFREFRSLALLCLHQPFLGYSDLFLCGWRKHNIHRYSYFSEQKNETVESKDIPLYPARIISQPWNTQKLNILAKDKWDLQGHWSHAQFQ